MKPGDIDTKVCKLFYQEGLTKTELEKRLRISRFKVARILKRAVETGLVKIHIEEPTEDLSDLEVRLAQATGLSNVILVPDDGSPLSTLKERAGKAAAGYLLEILKPNEVLGIGWGTTTSELVKALPESSEKTVSVVQVSGGNTNPDTGIDSQSLTVRLAQRLRGSAHLLHAPAVVDRPETRTMLMKESSLQEIFGLYGRITMLIAGIGALLPVGFLGTANETKEIEALQSRGAVGEFLTYCFDQQGRLVKNRIRDRIIAIPFDDLTRISYSMGLAVGREKADAILGVVRSGLLKTLITDTTTAGAILEKVESKSTTGRRGGQS